MINSATLQYCHYRKYLTYIESNLSNNNSEFSRIESKIGEENTEKAPKDSESFQRKLIQQRSQIQTEIYTADRALPRSIDAFKEMERTYAAHLLLVIVYDDYVRLRDNLARYMSSTSQLFEKANNAMTP